MLLADCPFWFFLEERQGAYHIFCARKSRPEGSKDQTGISNEQQDVTEVHRLAGKVKHGWEERKVMCAQAFGKEQESYSDHRNQRFLFAPHARRDNLAARRSH